MHLLNFKNFPKPYMSNMAKRLLFNMPINFTNESEVRNNNYDDWRRLLINNTKLNSVAKIPSISYVPYLCELILEDKTQMDEIFKLFKNANIPVSTWPDLAPEVLLDNEKHSVAIKMRMNRIFLPVHSSVNEKLIKFYLQKIRI